MNFQAYCFKCEKTVAVWPILPESEFWTAVERNADVEVMHRANDGDHVWKLKGYEKDNLRKTRAKGII
jgi:hypothetical protein